MISRYRTMIHIVLSTLVVASTVVVAVDSEQHHELHGGELSVCGSDRHIGDAEGGLDSHAEEMSLLQREMQIVGSSSGSHTKVLQMDARTTKKSPVHATALKSQASPGTSAINVLAWANHGVAGAVDTVNDAGPHVVLLQDGRRASIASKAEHTTAAHVLAHLRLNVAPVVIIALGIVLVLCMFWLGTSSDYGLAQDPLRPHGVRRPFQPHKSSPLSSKGSLPVMSGQLSSAHGSSAHGSMTHMSSPPGSLPTILPPASSPAIQAQVQVPPLCPQLILPHTEARFMIPMKSLQGPTTDSLDIMGTSGRKLLHAVVCDSPDGRRCLMLASPGCEEDPRACVFTAGEGSFEIFGKAGKFYGWLECQLGAEAKLIHSSSNGQSSHIMKISMGKQTDLHLDAFAMDGGLLASAAKGDDDFWKLKAKPGSDAVLITSCMLALALLRAWPS